jgi:predicted nucleic acid-binding Zn ribbon protein
VSDGRSSGGIRGGWPTRISELLGPALGGMGPRLWTEARLRQAWTQAVGPEVTSHASVRRLRGNVLEVAVTSDTWATELTYLGPAVIERLNAVLGDGTVAELSITKQRSKRR